MNSYNISSAEEAAKLLDYIHLQIDRIWDMLYENSEAELTTLYNVHLKEQLRELHKEWDDVSVIYEEFLKQNTGGTPYEQQ